MDHVRWLVDPQAVAVTRPVLVAAFTGWNDAGDAASTAVRTLIESSGARPIADIDPEHFTDFATIRPHVRLDDDKNRLIVWPTVRSGRRRCPATDVILVLGPEPALKLAVVLRARSWTSLSGSKRDGTHGRRAARRRAPHAAHADHRQRHRRGLDRALRARALAYEGRRASSACCTTCRAAADSRRHRYGPPYPGYASQLQSPRAAMALVERACSMMGTPAPVVRLARPGRRLRRQGRGPHRRGRRPRHVRRSARGDGRRDERRRRVVRRRR